MVRSAPLSVRPPDRASTYPEMVEGAIPTPDAFLSRTFALNTDGTIARLAIDFEQHCEGAPPALYGSFRYNSFAVAVPRLAVASTHTLKGNAGTSDALVTLSLCLPSTTIVQVAYATADGTAVQGTDYVNTTGTATFQPGILRKQSRSPSSETSSHAATRVSK